MSGGMYADGGGLWLRVSEWGTKAWLFRYMRFGKRHHMGLGPLHTVNLKEARERARQARQLILDGRDPLEVKREHIVSEKLAAVKLLTFAEVANQYLSTKVER
jgi:Arm DNA-binding domain